MPFPDGEEDAALVARCLARAPGAWEAFVRRFAPEASAAVRAVAGRWGLRLSDGDAADVLQETFLALWRGEMRALRAFRGECALSTYVRTVAASCLSRWRRREASAARPPVRPWDEEEGEPPAPILLSGAEDRAALRGAVDRLPERERRALLAFYWDGVSTADVARMLGLAPANARMILSRARARLAGLLKKDGMEPLQKRAGPPPSSAS